jgi:hypothetical protein
MAHAGCHDLDEHFARFRATDIDGLDGEGLIGSPSYSSARFHALFPF